MSSAAIFDLRFKGHLINKSVSFLKRGRVSIRAGAFIGINKVFPLFQILSIFAFATTTSVHSELKFTVNCATNTTTGPITELSIPVGYPFE